MSGDVQPSDNVVDLPSSGFAPTSADMAKRLEELAQRFRSGELDARQVVVIFEPMEGTVSRFTFGHSADLARVVGLMQTAIVAAVLGQD